MPEVINVVFAVVAYIIVGGVVFRVLEKRQEGWALTIKFVCVPAYYTAYMIVVVVSVFTAYLILGFAMGWDWLVERIGTHQVPHDFHKWD